MKNRLIAISIAAISLITITLSFIVSAQNRSHDSSESLLPDSPTKLSPEYDLNEDGYVWNYFDTINTPYDQGENYEIFSDKAQIAFYYVVKDNHGNMLDEGYHGWRGGLRFNVKDDLLELNYSSGGTYSWQNRYYDVQNGRVSRFFVTPLQTSGELIAYFATIDGDYVLIVENIFDNKKFHKEIRRNFSPLVMHDTSPTEFLDDNKQLKISYWSEPDDAIVTEIFDLK